MTRKTRWVAAAILFVFALFAAAPQASAGFDSGAPQGEVVFGDAQAGSTLEIVSRATLYLIELVFPGYGQPCKGYCIEAKESDQNLPDETIDDYQGDIPEDFGVATP